MNSDLYLRIDDLRAIAHAEINLNGISVIAGENGSGKSTISKLVYTILRSAIRHDDLIADEFSEELASIHKFLEQLADELDFFPEINKHIELSAVRKRLASLSQHVDDQRFGFSVPHKVSNMEKLTDQFIHIFDGIDAHKMNPSTEKRLNRIKILVASRLDDPEEGLYNTTLKGAFEALKQDILSLFEAFKAKKQTRFIDVLNDQLDQAFGVAPFGYDTPLGENFNVYELNVPLIDRDQQRILPVNLVDHVLYIDTPMVLGTELVPRGGRGHWYHLNMNLSQKAHGKKVRSISRFEKDVLRGEFTLEEGDYDDWSLLYKRKDGRAFDLLECATGLKSFAILQLLAKNGVLSDKTLLIIDEPEVHLHPQWVVEYARLMILLHKTIGVKFLIASHHPDMISALKYIGEKEGISDLTFYLSSPSDADPYKYTYENLGKDIEPIFSSFNIALDRIDQYGSQD